METIGEKASEDKPGEKTTTWLASSFTDAGTGDGESGLWRMLHGISLNFGLAEFLYWL